MDQGGVLNASYLRKILSDYNLLEITFLWGRVLTPIPSRKLQPQRKENPVIGNALLNPTMVPQIQEALKHNFALLERI
ncbi:hypothetical protein NDU88_004700 [Pleurodeles waltl]|uniref:Uncharacterized protein n=1 Tax=Pleurodeles waltl TaxID=8319 RepID=A0AAV7T8V1_PLEWA|nr:hypothetical protein NDU88_004700 [Pleurodeles waltl]